MKCLIFQQGSGSRIYSTYLTGEVWPEPFCVEPAPTEEQAVDILKNNPNIRLAYNHLEDQPWLYDLIKDREIIHMYRDPGRTFTRQMAKYKDVKFWTRDDLTDYVYFVTEQRKKVNSMFKGITIVHYEDFVRDLYMGDTKEFLHL